MRSHSRAWPIRRRIRRPGMQNGMMDPRCRHHLRMISLRPGIQNGMIAPLCLFHLFPPLIIIITVLAIPPVVIVIRRNHRDKKSTVVGSDKQRTNASLKNRLRGQRRLLAKLLQIQEHDHDGGGGDEKKDNNRKETIDGVKQSITQLERDIAHYERVEREKKNAAK